MRSFDSSELLFSKYGMFEVLENQKRSITTFIDQISGSQMLKTSDDVLVLELVERLKLSVPELQETSITVSQPREVGIDVSRDFRFGYAPQTVKGMEVTFSVPFEGDAEFFCIRPIHYSLNPPRAVIRAGELGFPFRDRDINAEQIRREFDGQLKSVKEFLGWQKNDVRPFNESLKNSVHQAVTRRRDKLQKAQSALGSLGFPVRG